MTKVIKASAGTGKTYRLSLEYIANLLQGENFENIVVMTFTRKATAEIRERILEHLAAIIKEPQTSEVAVNLKEVYPELELDVASLKIIYRDMISNKEQIKIYTIDSFVNTIFKQAIAPYLNIYDYQIIDSSSNQEIVEAVFKRILDNKNYFEQMEEFLSDNLERDIETYINLLQKIINNRWKFLLFDFEAPAEIKNNNLVDQFNYCVDVLEKIAQEKGNDYGKSYFRKAFRDCYAKEGQAKKEWL
ncbi:MAG: UvrD-helicase domain-containing protein, partial [Bacillota bacterium]